MPGRSARSQSSGASSAIDELDAAFGEDDGLPHVMTQRAGAQPELNPRVDHLVKRIGARVPSRALRSRSSGASSAIGELDAALGEDDGGPKVVEQRMVAQRVSSESRLLDPNFDHLRCEEYDEPHGPIGATYHSTQEPYQLRNRCGSSFEHERSAACSRNSESSNSSDEGLEDLSSLGFAPVAEGADLVVTTLSLSLRVLALRLSRAGSVYLAMLLWVVASFYRLPTLVSRILPPLLGLIGTLGCLAQSSSTESAYATRDQMCVAYGCCVTTTAFLAKAVLYTPDGRKVWHAVRVVRFALNLYTWVITLTLTVACHRRWTGPWTALRAAIALVAAAGLVSTLLIRWMVGPTATYMPGEMDLGSSLLVWCEILLVAMVSTPRCRAWVYKRWTVIKLESGVRVKGLPPHEDVLADTSRDRSRRYIKAR